MLFELDEDGTINRIPFYRQDNYLVNKSFNRKEEYYVIDENETIPYKRTLTNPLVDDIGEENYKKLREYQIENVIEYNKTKFLNFFSNDWVEVKKEKDAKYYLIVYKEYPNIFEIKKIYKPEEESNDKKIYYLKYLKYLKKYRRVK